MEWECHSQNFGEPEQWERVQELRSNKRRLTKLGKTSIFSRLVYCADCGSKLYFCASRSYTEFQNHFVCSDYESNTGSCKIHYIREVTLYKRALECIQRTLTYVQLFRDDFIHEMLLQDEAGRKTELAQKQSTLSAAEKYSNLQELDAVTVNELIQKIVVHSPEKIKGKKHVTIEIYFTYVGTIRIPLKKPNVSADAETQA